MGVSLGSPRLLRISTAVTAVALSAVAAGAAPAAAVRLSDGNVLNVSAVVGTGANSAYFAVDFSDGVDEAFQYNFTGTLNGYTLLTDVEAATTLRDVDTYYASFAEHFVSYVTDGANTTAQYPTLYYSPPAPGDTKTNTSPQGITYQTAQVGIDQVNVTNGTIIAFDNSSTVGPVLPETAVPEPAGLAAVGVAVAVLRRRRRAR